MEEALSVSLPPYLILSDTVLSLWCQLARRFLSHSLSLSLSPTLASTLVRPPVRVFEDLRGRLVRVSGSLSSLWAAIADRSHASRPVLVSRPLSCLLRTLLRSVLVRAHIDLRMPSRSAPPGNMVFPSAPHTPPQRIYRPGTHLDGSTESPRHPFSQSSSSPMFCSHRTHVTPLLPHCIDRQYTSPRHMATLSSSEGCSRNMQQVRFVFRSALTAAQRELATA